MLLFSMDGRLVYFCLLFVSLLGSRNCHENSKEAISNIFEGFGYSPVCIATALASCEAASKTNNSTKFSELFTALKGRLSGELNIEKKARNCDELLAMGDSASGVRIVYPYDCCRDRKVIVYCDQETDGGGWTVFQNRDSLPVREDFQRTWVEYSLGFGNVTGEFWLGLNNIHALVSSSLMEMRVDLMDYDDVKRWAKYGVFYIGDASSKYTLGIGRYSGDATDQLAYHNSKKFSTSDQDNDESSSNCASKYRGAWWFGGCINSNLNGFQHVGKHRSAREGINWKEFRGYDYSLKKASMKLRTLFRI